MFLSTNFLFQKQNGLVTFMLIFLNDSWCVSLILWRGILYWSFLPLFLSLCITVVLPIIFPSNDFLLWNSFFVLSTLESWQHTGQFQNLVHEISKRSVLLKMKNDSCTYLENFYPMQFIYGRLQNISVNEEGRQWMIMMTNTYVTLESKESIHLINWFYCILDMAKYCYSILSYIIYQDKLLYSMIFNWILLASLYGNQDIDDNNVPDFAWYVTWHLTVTAYWWVSARLQ